MTPLEILEKYFKYPIFREGQAPVIDAVLDLDNKGVLVVMPTGRGKSVCFQVPAMIMEGITLVVSPLKSLMKNQVDSLRALGISTHLYNSSLDLIEKTEVMDDIMGDNVKIIYVAPERFADMDFVSKLASIKVSLFVVDEAHMISQAGTSYRPSYRKLKQAIAHIKPDQVMALTATATPFVQKDICTQLGIPNAVQHIYGFYRDNLQISVVETSSNARFDAIYSRVLRYIKKDYYTGIVYVGRRQDAETLCEYLKEIGHPCAFYHAGLSDDKRKAIQDKWFKTGGIIVATSAFGMGIDRQDVRFVISASLPGNVEEWYQNIGRAGRDGNLSECVLFVDYTSDKRLQKFLIDSSCPSSEKVLRVWYFLHKLAKVNNWSVVMPQEDMANKIGYIEASQVSACITYLKNFGLVESPTRGTYKIQEISNANDAMKYIDTVAIDSKVATKYNQLNMMIEFAQDKNRCRMLSVLKHFSDKSVVSPCGKCDNCVKKVSK